MLIYAVTIFLSAFLLFQVQPLIAKFILPWFGGSAAVWSAALLFFQLLLLAGYTYAHFLIRYLAPKNQLKVHLPLLAVSLATLPIIPKEWLKPEAATDPTWQILLLLGVTIGLPYMILSSTSPLLQAWYLRTHEGVIPYRLFALSNFGSMLALLSYPFLIEPNIGLRNQAYIWSAGFGLFALVCAFAAWRSREEKSASREGKDPVQERLAEPAAGPRAGTIVFWVALAACASVLLMATTSHLTQNVAPVPLLWVVPLALYLLSFILSFESDRIYQRWIFMPLGLVALAMFTRGITEYEDNEDVIGRLIPMLCAALFICCMICHGELARRKPHPRYLTQFFLWVSVGGAIGGIFVALIAPRIFPNYWEMPIAIAGCALLMALALWDEETSRSHALTYLIFVVVGTAAVAYYTKDFQGNRDIYVAAGIIAALLGWAAWMQKGGGNVPAWPIQAAMLVAVAVFGLRLGGAVNSVDQGYAMTTRDFYGVLRVRDEPNDFGGYPQRVLIHGTINHGTQLVAPEGGRTATSYFGEYSGINRAVRAKGEKGPIRIGILGLGAGVTATLAREGDTLHYYEINPGIFDLAQKHFDFWKDCPADKQIFFGDGRLVLERFKESEQLDFLAMDAFTSDAVPMHLLTHEAYEIYSRHLKPDGALAINISNRYLNLEPIVAEAAKHAGFTGMYIYDDASANPSLYVANTWIILNRDPSFFNHPNFQDFGGYIQPIAPRDGVIGWSDDYTNIAQILHCRESGWRYCMPEFAQKMWGWFSPANN